MLAHWISCQRQWSKDDTMAQYVEWVTHELSEALCARGAMFTFPRNSQTSTKANVTGFAPTTPHPTPLGMLGPATVAHRWRLQRLPANLATMASTRQCSSVSCKAFGNVVRLLETWILSAVRPHHAPAK